MYVLVLDELRQEFAAAQLEAAVARGMGAEVELQSWGATKAAFDAELIAVPQPVDWDRELELRALGLR